MFRRYASSRFFVGASLIASALVLSISSQSVHATDDHRDTTFGTSGVASIAIAPNEDKATDVAVQSDGKIIVAGSGSFGNGSTKFDFVLARFNPDGTPDNSFSGDGKVSTDLNLNSTDDLSAITLQSDGKILAAGWSSDGNGTYIAVTRYTNDGSLDPTFDGDGKVFISALNPTVEDGATDILVQPDGKIVLIGYGFDSTVQFIRPVVVRLYGNGQTDYITVISTAQVALPYAGALQPDGKVVLVGVYGIFTDNLGMWRVDVSGVLDTSFGTAGSVISSNATYGAAVAIQTDGKIVVGGTNRRNTYQDTSIHRYSSSGELDSTFNGNGLFETSLSDRNDMVNDLVIRSDGSIVVVGQAWITNKENVFIAQVTSSGELDTRYSDDGFQIVSIGTGPSIGNGAALDSNGKVLVAAIAYFGGNADLAVMRINPPSSISTLSSLSVTGASFAETFSASTTSYSASVPNTTTSITLTPTKSHPNSSIQVNGVAVASGSTSAALPLTVGANVIPIVVTAEDAVTRTTYTVTVTRAAVVVSAPTESASGGTTTPTTVPIPSAPTTTSTTSTTVVVSQPIVNATAKELTLKVKKTITAKALLASREIKLASTSKVVITAKAASQKFCGVNGTTVKGLKKGACTVVVAVTPQATKTVKKPKTTKTTVTLRVA